MISIVGLFLIGMVVLALFGRIKRPGTRKPGQKCRHCGTPLIGKWPCPCGKGQ